MKGNVSLRGDFVRLVVLVFLHFSVDGDIYINEGCVDRIFFLNISKYICICGGRVDVSDSSLEVFGLLSYTVDND